MNAVAKTRNAFRHQPFEFCAILIRKEDVTAAITGNGTFAFQLSQIGTDSHITGSRESVTPPQLVVTP